MLAQITTTLENLIVHLIATAARGLTAQEIREQVAKKWKQYSRRGIYKELQRLEREGVLMRSQGRYSLRLAWALSLQAQIEQIVTKISHPDVQDVFLPSKDQDFVVTCSDLVRWDRVWTQLMLILHSAFPHLPHFQWVPRYWFNITHPDIQSTFIPSANLHRERRFTIIGGRTQLDYDFEPSLARVSCVYSSKRSPFESDRRNYRCVIGDYLITCTLDQRTADRIDRLFETTKDLRSLPKDAGAKLLAIKCRGTVRCSWSPVQAEKLRNQIARFLGVSLNKDGTVRREMK
jgi:hypothetical protein